MKLISKGIIVLAAFVGAEIAYAETTYEYDVHGRVVNATYDDGSVVAYQYDASDNRTQLLVSPTPPAFSVDDISVSEGGDLVFTVVKVGVTSQSHVVSYATANGTASSGDYVSASGTLTFGSGETTKTVTVTTVQDSAYELNETLFLNLSNVTNGATISDAQGVGTINNDDSGSAFSVNDVSVSEGGDLVFTITKLGVSSLSHSVDYAAVAGGASVSDFTATSGTLTFTSGQMSKTVTVATVEDASYEYDETVYLDLSNATNGAFISDNRGDGVILNDDAVPTFSVANVSVSEGENLVFTVSKVGATSFSHAVSYATANGTASSGDYVGGSGVLTFGSGEATKTVTVSTVEDSAFEFGETLLLNLSNATNDATISDPQGVGTITNDDAAPAFSVNNVSVSEGGGLVFTVTKSGVTSLNHAVNYATANGTAGSGDFAAASGALTFTSGQSSKTVTVSTVEDSALEANETLFLNLSGATNGASISDTQGVGTITNDDVNSPPVAVNDTVFVSPGASVALYPLVNDTDLDGHALTITYVSASQGGSASVSSNGRYINYTAPGGGWVDFLTYTISDGYGGTDSGFIGVSLQ